MLIFSKNITNYSFPRLVIVSGRGKKMHVYILTERVKFSQGSSNTGQKKVHVTSRVTE